MNRRVPRAALSWVLALTAGCDIAIDAATRLAYDIETGVGQLGADNGAVHSIQHHTPSKSGECEGPYKLQLDQVGAIIIWCYDASGQTVSSHSTTYHSRFVDTPQTYLLDKPAGATLTIELERRRGRAVVTDVH